MSVWRGRRNAGIYLSLCEFAPVKFVLSHPFRDEAAEWTGQRSRIPNDLLFTTICAGLRHFAEEEIDELYEQDEDYYDFKKEAARLVELLDHVVVKVFGGLEFLGYKILVIGHADFGGGKTIETRGEHVTEKLDGIVGTFGELGDVKQHGVKARGSARHTPARGKAALALERVVDV